MGNFVNSGPLQPFSAFDYVRGTWVDSTAIFVWRLLMFLAFVVFEVALLLITLFSIIFNLLTMLFPALIYFAIYFFLAFFWWYGFPTIAPYLRDIGVPLVNLFLELFVISWDIFLILWNLFAEIWNALVPLIGMLFYIVLEIFTSLLTEVVGILGSINIYSLLKPLIEIIQILAQILCEIIQAIVSIAPTVLKLFAQMVGGLIHVVASVISVLFVIIQWQFKIIYFVLAPILHVVVSIVGWFTHLFGGAAAFRGRALLEASGRYEARDARGGGGRDDFSGLHARMYPAVAAAGMRGQFNRESVVRSRTNELEHVTSFLQSDSPIHSWEYYYTVYRPALANLNYGGAAGKGFYHGEAADGAEPGHEREGQHLPDPGGGHRALLELAVENDLISQTDLHTLSRPTVAYDRYWQRFDRSPHNHLEWVTEEHINHEYAKRMIVQKTRARLAALHARGGMRGKGRALFGTRTNHHLNASEEVDGGDSDHLAESRPPRPHAFAAELDAGIECKHAACGGVGKILPHPIHGLRKMAWENSEELTRDGGWADEGETEGQYHRRKFLTLSAWTVAARRATDRAFWHIRSPLIEKHARSAWDRLVGKNETAGTLFERWHTRYGAEPLLAIHDATWDLSEWGVFGLLKRFDPERHTRPFYSDWLRQQSVKETRDPRTGRRALAFVPTADDPTAPPAVSDALHPTLPGVRTANGVHYALRDTLLRFAEAVDAWGRRRGCASSGERWRQPGACPEADNTQAPTIFSDGGPPAYGPPLAQRRLSALEDSDEEEELRNSMAQHAARQPLQGNLPFNLPNPIPGANAAAKEARRRQAALNAQRPNQNAILPLFDLLTQTDCFTTKVRNPLCFPTIPASWIIAGAAPQVKWPGNFNGSDAYCGFLYKDPGRTLNANAFFSPDWIYNAIQSLRLFLSYVFRYNNNNSLDSVAYVRRRFNVELTNQVALFQQHDPLFAWFFNPFFAIPPGKSPTADDILCFAEYAPYSIAYAILLGLIIYLIVIPLMTFLLAAVTGFIALYAAAAISDEQRNALINRNAEWQFRAAAADSGMNPGTRWYGDRNYFNRDAVGRPYTGYNPLQQRFAAAPGQPPMFGSGSDAMNQMGRYPRSGPMLSPDHAGATPLERANAHSTYALDAGSGNYVHAVPAVGSVSARLHNEAHAEDDAQRARAARVELAHAHLDDLARHLSEAAAAHGGLPSSAPPAWMTRNSGTLGVILTRIWNMWTGAYLREADLIRHQRHFSPFRFSVSDSVWYRLQVRNQARVHAYTKWMLSPAEGPFRRAFLLDDRASEAQRAARNLEGFAGSAARSAEQV